MVSEMLKIRLLLEEKNTGGLRELVSSGEMGGNVFLQLTCYPAGVQDIVEDYAEEYKDLETFVKMDTRGDAQTPQLWLEQGVTDRPLHAAANGFRRNFNIVLINRKTETAKQREFYR